MAQRSLYRHVIVNDDLAETIERFAGLIAGYRGEAA